MLLAVCLLGGWVPLTAKNNRSKKPVTPIRENAPIPVQQTLFQDPLLRQKPQTAIDSLFFPDVELKYQPLKLPVDSVFTLQPGPGGVPAKNPKWEYRLGGGQFRTAEVNLFHWNSRPKLDYGVQLNYQTSDNKPPNSARQSMGAAAMVSHSLFQENRLKWRAEWNQQDIELQKMSADTMRRLENWHFSVNSPFSLNPRTDLTIQADLIHHKSEETFCSDDPLSQNENEFFAKAQMNWQHSRGQLTFSSSVRNISQNRIQETTSQFYSAALSTSYLLLPKISAIIGIQYFKFAADSPKDTDMPGGKIKLTYLPTNNFGAFIQLENRLEYISHSQLCHQNHFSLGKFEDFATRIPLETKTGIDYLFRNRLHFRVSAIYSEIENYGYFTRLGNLPLYFFTALRGTVQRWQYRGALRLNTNGLNFIEITANYFDNTITENSLAEKIPFTEEVNIKLQLRHTFSNGVRLSLLPQYIGALYTNVAATQKLAAIWPVDLNIEWPLRSWLSLYATGINCLNEKYELWPGYVENEFQIKAGILGEW